MEAATGRGRVTPTSLSRRFGYRLPRLDDRRGRRPDDPICPVRSAHMRKITLPNGTMLALNASNHVPSAHLNAIPASRPATTNAMKTSPCAMPNTFTPISVRRAGQVLEIHADQQTSPADGLEQSNEPKPPSDGPKIKSACHGRHCARRPQRLLQRVVDVLSAPAAPGRRPARRRRTAPRRHSRNRVVPAQGRRAG